MIRSLSKIVPTALSLTLFTGCMGAKSSWMYPHASSETTGQSPEEHKQQVVGVLEQDRRALTEDLDLWFQTDRPTRLTRWHGR